MTWALVFQLMLRYGPEAVAGILDIVSSHPEPTKEAFDKILALALKPMDEYIKEAELRKLIG